MNKSKENMHKFILLPLVIISLSSVAETSFPFKECFEASATQYELEPSLIAAVASVESGLNPNAVSSSDALGLMQIKWPKTAEHLGITQRNDLFQPCKNIEAGSRYLKELVDRFESEMTALAAYHFGPTAVDREQKIPLDTLNYIQKVFNEKSYILASESFRKNLVCRPTDLQNLAIETHDPRKRRDRAIEWINGSGSVCSISELIFVRNRLASWLGTAEADGKARRSLDAMIVSKSSES